MKIITKSVLVAGVAVLGTTTMFAGSSTKPEMVHYSAKAAFTNDNVESGASGSIQVSETVGSTDKESVTMTMKGLTASTDYSVIATTTSNAPADIGDFTTDSKGGAKLSFKNSGGGKKNTGNPPDPLTTLTAVDIVNSSNAAVAVLSADMTTPQTFAYKVTKTDTTGNVTATVNISANTKSAKVSISASGLNPSSEFALLVGSDVVQTNTSTSKGSLNIKASGPPEGVLTIDSVSLQDTSSATVWSTSIP